MTLSADVKNMVIREQYLLSQFTNTLKVQLERLDPDKQSTAHEIISRPHSWHNAYQIELMLVDLYTETGLTVIWEKYRSEMILLSESKQKHYQDMKPGNQEELQECCRALITDIQWQRERGRVKRHYSHRMQRNAVFVFIFSFLFFFLPTILHFTIQFNFDSLRLYYLFTAASSGLLGASFSQLISLATINKDSDLEELRGMANFFYIFARGLMGAGAGLIMFYFLQSGFIESPVQPKFIQNTEELNSAIRETEAAQQYNLAYRGIMSVPIENDTAKASGSLAIIHPVEVDLQLGGLAQPSIDLSLLIVWCLVAGFFEKLIPSLLSKTQKKEELKTET